MYNDAYCYVEHDGSTPTIHFAPVLIRNNQSTGYGKNCHHKGTSNSLNDFWSNLMSNQGFTVLPKSHLKL